MGQVMRHRHGAVRRESIQEAKNRGDRQCWEHRQHRVALSKGPRQTDTLFRTRRGVGRRALLQSHEQLPVHQGRLRGGQVPKDATRAVLVAGRDRIRCSRIGFPNVRAFEGGYEQGRKTRDNDSNSSRERSRWQAESTPMD